MYMYIFVVINRQMKKKKQNEVLGCKAIGEKKTKT